MAHHPVVFEQVAPGDDEERVSGVLAVAGHGRVLLLSHLRGEVPEIREDLRQCLSLANVHLWADGGDFYGEV